MSTHHPLSARAQAMFEVIERYQASGQTQKAFCQSEAVALSTLQYWLARYRKHQHTDNHPQHRPVFVELKAEEPPIPSRLSGDDGVVVRYPNGVEVWLAATVELALLQALITLRPTQDRGR